jgi:hypothetical protein
MKTIASLACEHKQSTHFILLGHVQRVETFVDRRIDLSLTGDYFVVWMLARRQYYSLSIARVWHNFSVVLAENTSWIPVD